MKYYSYISNAKLDMLFPQIPRGFLEGVSGELSVNLGLLKTTLKDHGTTPTRLSKLDVVARYIEKTHDVGDISARHSYVRDVLEMRSFISKDFGVVLFTRYDGPESPPKGFNSILLSGSLKHTIGMESAETLPLNSNTHVILGTLDDMSKKRAELESELADTDRVAESSDYSEEYLKAIRMWSTWKTGPVLRYEFLAKTLVTDVLGDDRILLATPIYVALVD